MGNTSRQIEPLESRWPDYYKPGFKPEGFTDALRHRLLTTEGIDVTKPLAGKPAGTVRKQASAVLTNLRKLGYVVERSGDRVSVANRDHRPTPADFERDRQRVREYGERSRANGNGTKPTRKPVYEMLPRLGDALTVSVVGVDRGALFLVLTSADGWRYECSIESAEPPSTR